MCESVAIRRVCRSLVVGHAKLCSLGRAFTCSEGNVDLFLIKQFWTSAHGVDGAFISADQSLGSVCRVQSTDRYKPVSA